jgi:hypothetical protein
MTARHRVEVLCDVEDCTAATSYAGHRMGDARIEAAAAGWSYRILLPQPPYPFARGVDLCPAHADAYPDSVPASKVL